MWYLIVSIVKTENFNAMPQIIKCTEQCQVAMQITWLKLKLFDQAADSGYLRVKVEEKRRIQQSQKFDSFSSYTTAVINSSKLLKVKMDDIFEE